mmetsp:Transcript_6482/g.15761  ORF Transcript_6482/g.15761 Transcript_6482/m.15761 type:complete len:253 (-) Transcript_6482:156-914(-)
MASISPAVEKMDRGLGNEQMNATLGGCETMEIRHYRRGWMQEFFCCVTRSDFKYLIGGEQVAKSKEDFSFFCRCCFAPCHSFDMIIEDTKSDSDLIEINRPSRCCMATGKLCCLQEASIFSGEEHLGDIKENCWWFVPSFKVTDPNDKKLYMIHPPTCCFGGCVNCCPGGSCPCPHGCCMIPCDVYAVDKNGFEIQEKVGTMAKIPKKTFKECFNEINYYKVDFPETATNDEKGLLVGSSILVNALYFEHSE